MLTTLLLAAALSCPTTKVSNVTNETWNEDDQYNLEAAINGCPLHYPSLPCLIEFVKKEPNLYNATCGEPIANL